MFYHIENNRLNSLSYRNNSSQHIILPSVLQNTKKPVPQTSTGFFLLLDFGAYAPRPLITRAQSNAGPMSHFPELL